MDGLALTTATTTTATTSSSSLVTNGFLFPSISATKSKVRLKRNVSFTRRGNFSVFAAKEDPKLDQWDQMELNFGRLIGEDPKLTLAKIMAKKRNPDVSYMEVEKSFYKNKGKLVETEEVPFDASKGEKKSLEGLNLVRPVPKKGVKFQTDDKPITPEVRKPSQTVRRAVVDSSKRSVAPNFVLRKPNTFNEDVVEDKRPRYRTNLNPSSRMRNEQADDKFSDMTLLRRPNPMSVDTEDVTEGSATKANSPSGGSTSIVNEPEVEDDSVIGIQPLEQRNVKSFEEETDVKYQAALLGKPKRLDQSVKDTLSSGVEETKVAMNLESYGSPAELKNLPSASPLEDADWTRAEDLVKTGGRQEVELISSSIRGYMVSFGSLIGFLPYRNLAARWKFLAFESWLRRKGLDPSMYKQDLGIIESYYVQNKASLDLSADPEIDKKIEGEISPDLKLENLLRIYDQEKLKFLSSFVGQKIKVIVVTADRKSRKLIFSMRPKEKEELVEKKRSLMAKLRIGDVVKCCVKKITYSGIFVEVEGVPALIHQTEVSWAATLDPASYFKMGQIVDAKVHRLDFALGRIFLSLKEITPDPLIEPLESVVGGRELLDGRLEIAQTDTEWADVEALIKELQQIEGIQSVSKGRFFLSPGLAPTFQVYMASMFENQYKLLARSGNKVQEVIVQASLGKEEMKSTILSCTSRVE